MTFTFFGGVANGNASATLITTAFAAAITCTAVGHCLLLIFETHPTFSTRKGHGTKHEIRCDDLNGRPTNETAWRMALAMEAGFTMTEDPREIDLAWEARAKEAGSSRVRSFVVGQAF